MKSKAFRPKCGVLGDVDQILARAATDIARIWVMCWRRKQRERLNLVHIRPG